MRPAFLRVTISLLFAMAVIAQPRAAVSSVQSPAASAPMQSSTRATTIQVAFFDLGLTLIDGARKPFPHVPDALRTIQALKTADGKPLLTALVSDYDLAPTTPPKPADVDRIFNEFLGVLDGTGLRPFFEPVQEHVTLSTHAGVRKPNRAIFEKALERLGSKAPLEACLLITEDADHIRAARTELGMKALQFRKGQSTQYDFDDWSKAPGMVEALISR